MAQIPSVIAADVTVVGTLASSGDVTVEASVRGRIEGNVQADKVTLFAACNVKGDIVHGRLAIEDGARFEGNCRPSQSPGP